MEPTRSASRLEATLSVDAIHESVQAFVDENHGDFNKQGFAFP